MKFDSNGAWLDAMAAVRANRQVLLAVAGVFFLLPTLLSTVFQIWMPAFCEQCVAWGGMLKK